jgi:CheY-like chemotaxis protein/nitrogen-specific signal transduction histidine kinase
MLLVISLFGAGLAAMLCTVLVRINAARERADIQNQQKSNFLATMSHEMRTPLNAILGIAEICMSDENLAPDMTESLTKIYYSGDLLLRIINDLLDLSKIEAGKLEIMPVNYEVASLINDTVHLNMMRYESKPIEFKLHVEESVPAVMFGDELRIKQILNNLLSNAFKYTDKGEINFYVSAETVARGSMLHYMMVFRVSDTGMGMSKEQQAKLFDEYSRFNTEMNRTVSGTGLGMSIAQNLTRLMHGTISVESELGLGSVFTLRLPQEKVGSKVLGAELVKNLEQFNFLGGPQAKGSQLMRDYMPYGKVLIVDDVETNLYVAQGLITPYGISTETASSGFECLEKVEAGNIYDIIFMDHMMPRMDGIECTKKLRESGYNYPVVALTANAVVGQAEIFLQNGFDGFISKPIDLRQLNIALNQFIRDKQTPEVLEDARIKQIQIAEDLARPKPKDAELAKIFVRDAQKAADLIEEIFSKGDMDDSDTQTYIINVHAMKSALFAVKENDLSKVAQRLEQAGRDKDYVLIKAQTPVFLSALRSVIEKNTPEEEPETQTALSEAEKAELDAALKDIEEACDAYDKRKAKNLLAGLKEKKWPKAVNETLDKLSEHILHSDFEDAAALAKATREEPAQ